MMLLMLVIMSGILLAGCSQNTKEPDYTKTNGATTNSAIVAADDKTAVTIAAANQITIENFAFKPANLTVQAGTKVTWVNRDSAPHTATSTDQRFNSNALDTGDQFSFVFNDKGDYPYFCALHPQMKGQITVK